MNYQLTFSQGLLAIQTFSMMLTVNTKSQSTLEFSYFSGLLFLIPTTVILSKYFLIEPKLIFANENDSKEDLDKEKCLTLIFLGLFSTTLLLAWTLIFTTSLTSKLLLVGMFFLSSVGEGMKLFLLNFSRRKYVAKLNISLIFTSFILQQVFVSEFFYCVVLFYMQSLPFFFIFLKQFISCKSEKMKFNIVRVKETILQSAEGVLSFLQLFIFMWILRTMSQTDELISFQQSIILMTPLNSLANLITIGFYSKLLISNQNLLRSIFKWSLIFISLIYLISVMFDPIGYVNFLIKYGDLSDIKEWFVVQVIASCCSLYIVDKYFDLKARKLGIGLIEARCFEILLVSTIFFILILTNNTEYLTIGFLLGAILGTSNWVRVHRKVTN